MTKGISTNRRLTDKAAALRAAGVEFVFRYYCSSLTNSKLLLAEEAQAINSAGLRLAVVFQDFNNSLERFNAEVGRNQGRRAVERARSIGQPEGSAIYFAVDCDIARESEIAAAVHPYFLAVQEGLIEAGGGTAPYAVGVYGSGLVCRWLRARCDFVRYTWLAESTGWTGSAGYTDWNVKQSIAHGTLAGLTGGAHYEDCVADGSFGEFRLGEAVARERVRQPTRLVFTMPLRQSSELLSGTLAVLAAGDDSEPILVAEATSGQPGSQDVESLWAAGRGPLPGDIPQYEVETSVHELEIGSYNGAAFSILPAKLTDSVTGRSRGDFSLHGPERTPGSRGGIVLLRSADFTGLVTILRGARRAKLPLEVRYEGHTETVEALPRKAVFSMRLRKTSTRIDGTFTLLDAGGAKVFEAAATSGLAGHQHPDDLWLRNHGPIPPIDDRKTMETAEYESNLVGPAFRITPEVFRADGKSRSAFRVHVDGGTPGSAGCIVLRDPAQFEALRRLMRRVAPRVRALELVVDYG